jgi:CRP-like cAMP-binding protein
MPHLTPVELAPKHVIYDVGERVREVYFPERGVVSLLIHLSEGHEVEATTVGSEGFVGLAGLFQRRTVRTRHVVQVTGSASRLPLDRLHALMAELPLLRSRLDAYVEAFTTQLLQSVACNAIHNATQRGAKWLLMACDRSNSADLDVTHESLAEMLGLRRTTVSAVLRDFQRSGAVRCQRGIVSILDRGLLERAACECYGVMRRALDDVHLQRRPS